MPCGRTTGHSPPRRSDRVFGVRQFSALATIRNPSIHLVATGSGFRRRLRPVSACTSRRRPPPCRSCFYPLSSGASCSHDADASPDRDDAGTRTNTPSRASRAGPGADATPPHAPSASSTVRSTAFRLAKPAFRRWNSRARIVQESSRLFMSRRRFRSKRPRSHRQYGVAPGLAAASNRV